MTTEVLRKNGSCVMLENTNARLPGRQKLLAQSEIKQVTFLNGTNTKQMITKKTNLLNARITKHINH